MNTCDTDKHIRSFHAIFHGEDFVKSVSSVSDIVAGTVKKTVDNSSKIENTGDAFKSKLIITDETFRPLGIWWRKEARTSVSTVPVCRV